MKFNIKSEEQFRRGLVQIAAIVVVVGTGLSLLMSVFIFQAAWKPISFPSLMVLLLVTSLAALFFLRSGRIRVAGGFVSATAVVGGPLLLLLPDFSSQFVIPTIMLGFLMASVVFSARYLFTGYVIGSAIYLLCILLGGWPTDYFITGIIHIFFSLLPEVALLYFTSRLREERIDQLAKARLEAEDVSRLKSEFVATMSHELRTPLSAIIQFDKLLIRAGDNYNVDKRKHLYERIQVNSEQLLQTIEEILDIAKIEAGQEVLVMHDYNPRDIAEEAVSSLQSLVTDGKVQCTFEPQANAPDSVYGDERKSRHILQNLLANALKFTSLGNVTLSVGCRGEHEFYYRVADSGIGIPADKLGTIFERFRQVDSSDRRAYAGSGLGLSIVKTYVQMQGGEIQVQSELGRGSTFTVYLPLHVNDVSPVKVK